MKNFKAIAVNKDGIETLASSWIRLQYTDRKSDRYMPLIQESMKLDELSCESPSASLEVIACILAQDSSDHILANLGAGPLEDLLARSGASIIDEIEEWATRDELFRRTLSMTWKQQIQEDVWARVQAAAAPIQHVKQHRNGMPAHPFHAFINRQRPSVVVCAGHPNTHEYEEAKRFYGLNWQTLEEEFLSKNSDALFALSAEAFRYFLPAFMLAGLNNDKQPLLIIDTLLGMLERGPNPELWDQFFMDRWSAFSTEEYQAIREWLLVLSERKLYDAEAVDRAFDTIEIFLAMQTRVLR
jgi:hypothetical protein